MLVIAYKCTTAPPSPGSSGNRAKNLALKNRKPVALLERITGYKCSIQYNS